MVKFTYNWFKTETNKKGNNIMVHKKANTKKKVSLKKKKPNGLTAAQKKLPLALQKQFLKKKK